MNESDGLGTVRLEMKELYYIGRVQVKKFGGLYLIFNAHCKKLTSCSEMRLRNFSLAEKPVQLFMIEGKDSA